MKAKNHNSMNVYIDEKGQIHTISYAINKALATQRKAILEEVRSVIKNERFIECLDDILDLGSNGIDPKEELLKKLSLLEGKTR